ncbi:hypothetical protein Zmor_018263 [Zophobas morio]|uniref:Carboxylic ester hydrolase n=1 Tax=Zophobas morio TaxID=2755281 RepID=A0AA38IAW1_9CUCU|nr:hypothetical protein Zmor_018263 [Zophobas morio]
MYKTVVFLVTIIKVVSSVEDPIVELPKGKILGRQATTFANTPFYVFQKIPYATPPVGALRFKAPQPAEPWEGVLNTTYLDVSCYQQIGDFESDSEDCLFVNVYTPTLPVDNENVSLPVMFFVHGGAFVSGWSMYYPPDLFIDNEVILVTINYRLGVFGFLSTGDEVIPGNNGFKDQRLAIQWTHDNIHLFGGDPEKITIFGESAGSISISYQLLNLDSDGLFRAAILQSGSFLCPWSYQRNPRRIAFETAAVLNSTFSSSDDSNALLEFLQSVSAHDLDAAAEHNPWDDNSPKGISYGAVTEVKNPDAFITKKMYGLLQAGTILRVPVVMGLNSEENLLYNQDPVALQAILEAWDDNLGLLVPEDMQITDSDELTEMGKSIRDIYTDGEPFGTRLGDGVRSSSDTCFSRPVTKHAELASAFSQIYFYEFSYNGAPGNISVHYDAVLLGCSFTEFTESDTLTSQRLITLWTNFAKYQNPTPELSELFQNITWSKLVVENGDFLYLDINEELEIKNHPKSEIISRWKNLYDSLNFTDFDTY